MTAKQMTQLAKFTFKTYAKPNQSDPVQSRRNKLLAAIELQKLALAAALKGERYSQPQTDDAKPVRAVRPWFVAQDGGFYVQCRYGARPILLDGTNNALFVNKLEEVGAALAAFAAATKAGELDVAIAAAADRKRV